MKEKRREAFFFIPAALTETFILKELDKTEYLEVCGLPQQDMELPE